LTTGLTKTFDDNFNGKISDDNIVHQLVRQLIATKSYAGHPFILPGAGTPPHARHPNPAHAYLSDVTGRWHSGSEHHHPFTQFTTDPHANVTYHSIPFIEPNLMNDAPDGACPGHARLGKHRSFDSEFLVSK
jgi:hypothetical protein